MGISIITPHYNSLSGLKSIFSDLKEQTSDQWEWIIVDDCSDASIQDEMRLFFQHQEPQVQLIFNSDKSNASRCRNIGAQRTKFEQLVFLDADDFVLPSFVENRQGKVAEFKVFLNMDIVNEKGETQPFSNIKTDFLNNFLKACYPWQTTAMVWNKNFFNQVGQFDENLTNLQDVEISIRALLYGNSWELIPDNPVDFRYFVTPINPEKRSIEKISNSVIYLVEKLIHSQKLTVKQTKLLSNFFYVCIRYYIRGKIGKEQTNKVKKTLKRFYQLKIISPFKWLIGRSLVSAFNFKILSKKRFVDLNRYFFKVN